MQSLWNACQKRQSELLAAQKWVPLFPTGDCPLYPEQNQGSDVGSHGKTTITAMVLHVLNYHQKSVDYMIGAQLEGFENSVFLSENNEFIILKEMNTYLSIDLRPKFHHYKPQITLISGIAWDHVNVFKTQADYNRQFEIFIESITAGGVLVFNEEDDTCKMAGMPKTRSKKSLTAL